MILADIVTQRAVLIILGHDSFKSQISDILLEKSIISPTTRRLI